MFKKPSHFIFLVIFLLLSLFSKNGFAIDVSLTWESIPEQIDGYRVYYKSSVSGPPYNGFEAAQGNSPITVGNVNTCVLEGLPAGRIYYFAITAFEGGIEGNYSNEVYIDTRGPIIKSIKIR